MNDKLRLRGRSIVTDAGEGSHRRRPQARGHGRVAASRGPARARRQDVEQVLIGGELVRDNGAPTRFDLQVAAAELVAQLRATRFAVENQQAVQALLPHLRACYAGWEEANLDPWIVYGSKRQVIPGPRALMR